MSFHYFSSFVSMGFAENEALSRSMASFGPFFWVQISNCCVLGVHHTAIFNFFHQIETLVLLTLVYDSIFNLVGTDACHVSIILHRHYHGNCSLPPYIYMFFFKLLSVAHSQYPNFLAIRLRDINFIIYSLAALSKLKAKFLNLYLCRSSLRHHSSA